MELKVGLFFGSFNPIHNGHLAIARYMVEHGGIDKLWFVVSPQNPFKEKNALLDDHTRLEMVKLAVEGEEDFEVTSIEFELPQPSFTIHTLDALKGIFPTYSFFLIMGSDNYVNLPKWKEYLRILGEYPLLIYPRPGFDTQTLTLEGTFKIIDAPLLPISSTEIREKILRHENVEELMPLSVCRYIESNLLYR